MNIVNDFLNWGRQAIGNVQHLLAPQQPQIQSRSPSIPIQSFPQQPPQMQSIPNQQQPNILQQLMSGINTNIFSTSNPNSLNSRMGNIVSKPSSNFTKSDPSLIAKTLLGVIPGGEDISNILNNTSTLQQKQQSTVNLLNPMEEIGKYGLNIGKAIVTAPFRLGETAGRTYGEALGPLIYGKDFTPGEGTIFGGQSIQEQRRQLMQQGAGSVVEKTLPTAQYLIDMLMTSQTPNLLKQGIKTTQDWLKTGNQMPTQVEQLSQVATNSLENKPGEKPNAVNKAIDEIKTGNTPPVKIRQIEDGSTVIEDGRHHLEAAKQLGLPNYPVEDVTSHYKPPVEGGVGITTKNLGESDWGIENKHNIVVNGKNIGHIIGSTASKNGIDGEVFSVTNTQIDNVANRGKGYYQDAIQKVANKYSGGAVVDKYQASKALQGALRKVDGVIETDKYFHIPPSTSKFEVNTPEGARSFGTIKGNTADIVNIDAGGQKGTHFFEKTVNDLSQKGVKTINIKLQNEDSTAAIKRMVDKGILTNPRNSFGSSGNEYNTTYDIAPKSVVEGGVGGLTPQEEQGANTFQSMMNQAEKTKSPTLGLTEEEAVIDARLKAERGYGLYGNTNEPPPPESLVTTKRNPLDKPKGPIFDQTASINNPADMYRANYANKQLSQSMAQFTIEDISKVIKTENDVKLFRKAVEDPDLLDSLANKSENPGAFRQAVNSYSKFTDFVYKRLTSTGARIGYLRDYYSHLIDFSKPGEFDRFNQLMDGKAALYQGWFSKERVFANIADLEKAGFKLRNATPMEDIADYTYGATKRMQGELLSRSLQKLYPNEFSSYGAAGRDVNGQSFIHADDIPGLEGSTMTKKLYGELKAHNLQRSFDFGNETINNIAHVYDKLNSLDKMVKLSMGAFHDINLARNYIVGSFQEGQLPRLDLMARYIVDKGGFNEFMLNKFNTGSLQDFIEKGGTIEKGIMNQEFGLNEGEVVKKGGLNIFTPLREIASGMIGRASTFMKMSLWDRLPDEMRNPEMAQNMNEMFGGLNRETGGSVLGGKNLGFLGRAVALASDYQEGRVRQFLKTIDIRKGDAATNYARINMLGVLTLTALTAEVLRKVTTGNFSPNVKSFVQNSILDPNFSLPYKSPTGKQLEARLPSTQVSDLFRASGDPSQFITSRGAALPATVSQLLSGKNYYGQDLVANPSANVAVAGAQRVGALIPQNLPIPAQQAYNTVTGKQNVATALLNTIGLRVGTSPNDPSVIYAKTRQALYDQQDKPLQTRIDFYNTLKGSDPSTIAMKDLLLSKDTALYTYLRQLASQTGNGDPLYTAPVPMVKTYLQYTYLKDLTPGSTEEKQYYKNNITALQQFSQQRATYFQANPIPGQTGYTSAAPQASNEVQQLMNAKQWNNPQVKQYLQANLAYQNQMRANQGLTPIDSYGNIQGSTSFGSGGGGYSARMPTGLKNEIRYSKQQQNRQVKNALTKAGVKSGLSGLKGGKSLLSGLGRMPKSKTTKAKAPKVAKVKMPKMSVQQLLAGGSLGKYQPWGLKKVSTKVKKPKRVRLV